MTQGKQIVIAIPIILRLAGLTSRLEAIELSIEVLTVVHGNPFRTDRTMQQIRAVATVTARVIRCVDAKKQPLCRVRVGRPFLPYCV